MPTLIFLVYIAVVPATRVPNEVRDEVTEPSAAGGGCSEAEGDHYEETNSVGKHCAADLAKALEESLSALSE